jgi:hypothetical protein
MTNPIGSTTLVFQAPPAAPDDDTDPDFAPEPAREIVRRPARTGGAPSTASGSIGAGGALRMLKGARQAAAGMKISDEAIREVIEDPHDVQPDPTHPERTRLKRGALTVTTGQDGMILRVTRRK